jgi:hypothetical protein
MLILRAVSGRRSYFTRALCRPTMEGGTTWRDHGGMARRTTVLVPDGEPVVLRRGPGVLDAAPDITLDRRQGS